MGGRTGAWRAAQDAADASGVRLEAMTRLEDAERVRGIIEELWGVDELSPALIRALQHAGCAVYGARSGGDLVGFVLGFGGTSEGLHLHSHMLGVIPEWQSKGVGFALKLAQRAACLDAGINEVRWTYDPLVARNAWFNLVKLGTVATGLLPGFYGEMTDRINRGDRSDRFEVRWRLTSNRVERALSGGAAPPRPGRAVLEVEGDDGAPVPVATGAPPAAGAVVAVPLDHAGLRERHPDLGRAWRDASALAFQACFEAGLAASWIGRDGRYVFEPAAALT